MVSIITWGLEPPGKIIHEAGTVRMGDDPKKSALNKWSQAHDAKNVFCVDGGQFVSPGRQEYYVDYSCIIVTCE